MSAIVTAVVVFVSAALGVVVGALLTFWLLVELTKPRKE